ncbi:MAG: NAD-dependent epimerase/dehydratase family protein [Planctomycetota bacterium]|nr:NAD-dependent epimerase/dehydratase family protein [Planctomycetota bacterium]MDG2142568.1 NAD-dependent epimerase/dehydratase family protein [Planctomycetota bacterium]
MKALVTGGGGFLGGAIVEMLLARGDEVVSVSRGSYPKLQAKGVACYQVDLGDELASRSVLAKALEGCDAVFHVAAKAGIWGKYGTYHAANVDATRNIVEAALRAGVERFVHTSSPSVCFDAEDEIDAKNDVPYAEDFLCAYPETKAIAEKLALAANGNAMAVCALRPHLIFGPGDPHLLPRLIQRAQSGRLRQVGNGANEVTMTYVDNAAHAHILAADKLAPGAAHAGKAYFIGQEESVNLWGWLNSVLKELQIPKIEKSISASKAMTAGRIAEFLWKWCFLPGEPPMTRFIAAQLSTWHTFSMAPARADFGYREVVPMDVATERAIDSLRSVRRH